MAFRKRVTFGSLCLFAGLALSSGGVVASADQALPTIPVYTQPPATTAALHDPTNDDSDGASSAFNTPSISAYRRPAGATSRMPCHADFLT